MWKSTFLALGVFTCILGVECLLIDKAVMARSDESKPGLAAGLQRITGRRKEIVPADWAPWSLMSVGAVTALYSVTLTRKKD